MEILSEEVTKYTYKVGLGEQIVIMIAVVALIVVGCLILTKSNEMLFRAIGMFLILGSVYASVITLYPDAPKPDIIADKIPVEANYTIHVVDSDGYAKLDKIIENYSVRVVDTANGQYEVMNVKYGDNLFDLGE